MERFIHNENIRRYRKLLEDEQNEEKRHIIQKLLTDEEAKDVGSPERRWNSRHPQNLKAASVGGPFRFTRHKLRLGELPY
jgi:hypothetical protein